MIRPVDELNALAKECDCGNAHFEISIDKIVINSNALNKAVSFMAEKQYKKIGLIADENTIQAGGHRLNFLLKKGGMKTSVCCIKPDENGDVAANEISIVQVLTEIPKEIDVLLAVGSGTIHDITRFCSDKMNIPFISIPTAPSVDGYSSMGAPLLIRGVKKTFQTVPPIAIFADSTILREAPTKMIAAGFGDMLGKYTSLCDWQFGEIMADEPYCPFVAQLMKDSLHSCMENIDTIAAGEEKGIHILMEALIQSGLAMLIFGQSHPASGGEHHISHYWEMEFIQNHTPQVLHGAKVGVSTSIIAELYKNDFIEILNVNDLEQVKTTRNDTDNLIEKLRSYKDDVEAIIHSIPDPQTLRMMMEKVGGPPTPEQLGIDSTLVKNSVEQAHLLRDRYTVLKFLNEVAKE